MDLQFYSNITTQTTNEVSNHFTINIYSTAGYSGEPTKLDVTNAVITRQNSSVFDPIISSGFKLDFVNNIPPEQLVELQENYDKAYLCEVIDTDNTLTIFKGYLAQDIIEVSLDYQNIISLEFSDYLKKLDDLDTDCANGDYYNLGELMVDSLAETGIEQKLIINASLHPNGTNPSATTCYFKETLIDTNNFISGDDIDSVKSTVTKVLTPFNSFLYSWDNAYYIENYLDIDNEATRNWMKLEGGSYTNIPSQRSILTEQNDFNILKGSTFQFESGLKELDVNLKQKLYDNLVRNNFDSELDVTFTGIVATNPARGQWYYYQPTSGYPATFGNGWGDIGNYIRVNYPIDYSLLGTNYWASDFFWVKSARIALDRTETSPQNTLSLEGTVRRNILVDYDKEQRYCLPFSIKILSGVNKGKYLKYNTSGDVTVYSNVNANIEEIPRIIAYGSFISTDTTVKCSTTVDFTPLLAAFGTEVDVDILVMFHHYYFQPFSTPTDFGIRYYNTQIIGNVKAKYSSSLDDNKIVASVSDNYTKKQSVDLSIFDTSNSNYTNSLYTLDIAYYNRVKYWMSDYVTNDTWQPLTTKYISSMYSFYSQTRKKFIGELVLTKPLKPISLLVLNGHPEKFFVSKIQHNLSSNSYKVEAYELGMDEINVTE